MDTLKMRFKLNSLEFEIEGEQTTVRQEFESFKEFISSQLLPQSGFLQYEDVSKEKSKSLNLSGSNLGLGTGEDDFPVLKQVIKLDLPKNEQEWILVYAFYASKFGEEIFSDTMVKELYEETGRKTEDRMRGFSRDITRLISKALIKIHNDKGEYMFKPAGIDAVKNILNGQRIENRAPRAIPKKTKKKSTNEAAEDQASAPESGKKRNTKSNDERYQRDNNLNLFGGNGVPSLKAFLEEKKPKNKFEFNSVAVYYLKEIIKLDVITLDHLYTCYAEAKERPADFFKQSVRDTKSKLGTVTFDKDWHLSLPLKGKTFVEFDMPTVDKPNKK
jgi:hypothetical protein